MSHRPSTEVCVPVFDCKGTNKWAQYKTKNDFFAFIVEREYLRASLRGTNKWAQYKTNSEISADNTKDLGSKNKSGTYNLLF